ncbi:cupin domain-containing protein [Photorhabdus sp. RM323S]|uniref:cupin domain-containing protein n=1 Tax=Photorhabdus sp. RM323S TaxID=3342828 RepID=UPI0036DB40C0
MNKLSDITLVKRDEIPSMRTIEVDGIEHWLGHVKDFMKNKSLVSFLPGDNRISMAWVRLEAGEELNEHTHPVESMILMCEGGAHTTGEVKADMNAGDILLVPPGRLHGFKGMEPNGFWGLSIQFDSRGLYEDITDPWAIFYPEMKSDKVGDNIAEQLFQLNEKYMDRFDKHRLFALVRKGLLKNPEAKKRFLDCFQVWSNHFQKMVLTRVITLQDPKFEELAWLHLIEELGHNRILAKNRTDLQTVFDPVLESTSAWFPWKMNSISDIEKVVLVHLVVEASATFFYKHIQPEMVSTATGGHFDIHTITDDEHMAMGYEFLRNIPLSDGERLFEIQHQGWSMLMSVMGRIADLVVYNSDEHSTNNKQTKESGKGADVEMAN